MSFNHPELIWVIEPENKIRFRYESEGGSHGALNGKAGKKTYPTLELKNYHGKRKILVRATLYTEDRKEHVFEFKGKKSEGSKRYVDEELQKDKTVVFKSLHILCKKKYEIEQILMDRKIKNLKDGMSSSVRKLLEKNYAKDVKDRARSILNSLRLRFDAFEADKPGVVLCTLFSDVISNSKAAGKGELRITRLSQIAGSWKGGDEIILLCEKVQKESIKVKFYETNENDDVIWRKYGIFSLADVHYQVAITFKTPPYKTNEEKKVLICLERDGELSEPREFTYKPDEPSSKKRKLDTQEFSNGSEICPGAALFPELQEPIGSVSSFNGSSPSTAGPDEMSSSSNLSLYDSSNHVDISDDSHFDINEINNFIGFCLESMDKNSEDFLLPFDDFGTDFNESNGFSESDQRISKKYIVPSMPTDTIDASKSECFVGQMMEFTCIDAGLKNLKLKNEDENESGHAIRSDDKLDCSQNYFPHLQHKQKNFSKFLLKTDEHGNTFLHMAVALNRDILPILKLSHDMKVDLTNIQNHKNQTALHIATEKNRCETVKILLKCGSNPNLRDSSGNTCYHIATKNNFSHILQEINRFSRFDHEVCVFNDEGLTPMHLAFLQKNPHSFTLLKIHMTNSNIVEKKAGKSLLHYAVEFHPSLLPFLLEIADLDVNIQDFEGNTPLHTACANENMEVIKILLQSGADPSIKNFKQNFNTLDIENSDDDVSDGELPADLTTNLEILKLLSAASMTLVEDTSCLQDSGSFQESYKKPCLVTEELCKYLNEDMKWKKLVPFFLEEDVIDSLNLSSSPAKTLLDYVKKQEQDNYQERLKTALEFADLKDGVTIMNEINVVN